jgi:UDP-MurNAc hydroxylase
MVGSPTSLSDRKHSERPSRKPRSHHRHHAAIDKEQPLRITGLGHAGLYIETAAGSVLCDPWRNPAYFASWFVFPDNSRLDWAVYERPDYLYVSHLHRDHYDADSLRRIAKTATVLLPEYPTDELRHALEDLGFRSFMTTRTGEPVELDGLRMMIQALTAPTDGPIGDSVLAIDDGRFRLVNQNDARPPELETIAAFGPYDAHLLQFSGAIWYPMVYDMPANALAELGRRKRAGGMTRALRYAESVGARYVFPIAGPACFLDERLFRFNDFDRDETNIFPDQAVFLDFLTEHGLDNGRLLIPGSVADLADERCAIRHPIPDDELWAIFEDKKSYLERYAERARPGIEAERSSWPEPGTDVLAELKMWFEPLLAEADRICEGVGGPVLVRVGDLPLVIDFSAREVRQWNDEPCRYEFEIERSLVEALIRDHQVDWSNSLFLSLRFTARRIGRYNEYLYTFFKCLSKERINYVEGWYSEQEGILEEVSLGDWVVQRRCPHLKADLTRFGEVDEDGVLTCHMHGWCFDLRTGRCLTADGHPIQARRRETVRGGTTAD